MVTPLPARPGPLARRWHAMPEDTIGGWCVMDGPDAPSTGKGETMAGFAREEVARHVTGLHNAWLADVAVVPAQPLFPDVPRPRRPYEVTVWVQQDEDVPLRPDGMGCAPGVALATVATMRRYTVVTRLWRPAYTGTVTTFPGAASLASFRPDHEVVPRPGTARSIQGANEGQRADLRNSLHYPVEAECGGCGEVVRCERYLFAGWKHVAGRQDGGAS